jgi:cold shock CspA family protein
MPKGRVSKVVHLSLQSSDSADASPAPKGYGYLIDEEADGGPSHIYFDAKSIHGYLFDDLQVGQEVEYDLDPKLPMAKQIRLIGAILSPPAPQVDLP